MSRWRPSSRCGRPGRRRRPRAASRSWIGTSPRGLPRLITTPEHLAEATRRLREGTGPVAVDAERASGFRYGHRAFLVQLRRNKAGTVLIDPIACPDLAELDHVLAGTEAVLHAANQDLPCLA